MKNARSWMAFALFVCFWAASLAYSFTAEDAYQAGLALYKEGQYPQAIVQLQEATRLNPLYWQAYQVLGYSYDQVGNPTAAMDACQASLKINPNNPTLQNYVETTLKPQESSASTSELPPPPTKAGIHNSFYVNVGVASPYAVDAYVNNWSAGYQIGAGYGFGITPNISLVADVHYSNFPLDYNALGLSGYSGGGSHILAFLLNGKFIFVDAGNPVLFYGIVGLGPAIFIEDGISGQGYNGPGYSEVDVALRLGIGIDVRLNSNIALTLESNGVDTFVSPNVYDSPAGGANVFTNSLFNVGLKFDN